MPTIELDNLDEVSAAIVNAFINEGKLRAFEELIELFEKEYFATAAEDPYYGYYVKFVIQKINELYLPLKESVE